MNIRTVGFSGLFLIVALILIAQPVAAGEYFSGTGYEGVLDYVGTGEVQSYSMDVTSGDDFTILALIYSQANDFDLYVYDPSGTLITAATAPYSTENGLTYIWAISTRIPGRYVVKIHSTSGSGYFAFFHFNKNMQTQTGTSVTTTTVTTAPTTVPTTVKTAVPTTVPTTAKTASPTTVTTSSTWEHQHSWVMSYSPSDIGASSGDQIAWKWDFGDGSTSTQKSGTHTYTSEGWWTVKLTVTYKDGSTETGSYRVHTYTE
jgi:plastocyanin